MAKLSLHLDKAQYRPGDRARVVALGVAGAAKVTASVSHLMQKVSSVELELSQEGWLATFPVPGDGSDIHGTGFGLDVTAYGANGVELATGSIAFDVVKHWRQAPRYGFVTSFAPGDAGAAERFGQMNRLHLNVIQFYDWMYRHHQFLPPSEEFTDALGRALSLQQVRKQVQLAQQYGMAAMGYAAMYGAEKDFVETHATWVAADAAGNLHNLGNFIFVMNPAPNSPWRAHVLNEFQTSIKQVGFAGLHIDQYGFPKRFVSLAGDEPRVEAMDGIFRSFITDCRAVLGSDTGIIFNCVNNWPVDLMAGSEQDVVYIEVWPPHVRYRHLQELVHHARALAGGKQVILAAYLEPFHPDKDTPLPQAMTSALLATAAIASSGGFHLLLGEGDALLTDPYYPKFRHIPTEYWARLVAYYDFLVRYQDCLNVSTVRDITNWVAGNEVALEGVPVSTDGETGSVWLQVHEQRDFLAIPLVNLVGLEHDLWNSPHKREPQPQDGPVLRLQFGLPVKEVIWATPDRNLGRPVQLPWKGDETSAWVQLPRLDIWGLVVVRLGVSSDRSGA